MQFFSFCISQFRNDNIYLIPQRIMCHGPWTTFDRYAYAYVYRVPPHNSKCLEWIDQKISMYNKIVFTGKLLPQTTFHIISIGDRRDLRNFEAKQVEIGKRIHLNKWSYYILRCLIGMVIEMFSALIVKILRFNIQHSWNLKFAKWNLKCI